MRQSQRRSGEFRASARCARHLVRVTLFAMLGAGALLVAGVAWSGGAAFERAFHQQVAAFGAASESLSAGERQQLQTVLREGAPEAKVEAARELAHWRDQASVGELIRAMQDGSGVRRPCQIAHALGRIGDPEALPALQVALDHPDNTDLRACAALAIGEIGDASALPFLIDRIERGSLTHASRVSALFAVWDIADLRALPDLQRIAQQHADPKIRHLAASASRALARLAADDPTQALLDELTSEAPWVRSDWVLRQLKRTWAGPSSVQTLNAFLRSRPELKRSKWLWLGALLEHHDAWEAETLAALAEFENVYARRLVAIANSPAATPVAQAAANQPNQFKNL